MEASKKALELFDKFYDLDEFNVQCSQYCYGGTIDKKSAAKACAILCVDEILATLDGVWADVAGGEARSCQYTKAWHNYWQKVRNEIEKL